MYRLLRPLLFSMDAERAHNAGMRTAQLVQKINPSMVEPLYEFERGHLRQKLWGIEFLNPIGLAAGFDKNAQLIPFWEKVGFGFVEAGSVSARPAEGNPRPRAFRLPDDRALINRMGLNNDGAQAVAKRLRETENQRWRPLGINIVKTHDPSIVGEEALEDFRTSFALLAPEADYMALNISCPNTREGKTFEDPDALDELLGVIFAERERLDLSVPILVKLSPPHSKEVVFDSQLDEIIAVADAHGVHGYIASNTAPDRAGLTASDDRLAKIGEGGLSGRPLADRATVLVRYLYNATNGRVPIIGVGGVDSAEAAYEKIRAGASLVQLYTGLVYNGPGIVKTIKEELVHLIARDNLSPIEQAVGVDA
jgi:dihydroorotate dehydrogenase